MLLNACNLVLKNQTDEIVWQSFDYPTDILLPAETLTISKSLIFASTKSSLYLDILVWCIVTLTCLFNGLEISSVHWCSPDPSFNVWVFGRTPYKSSIIASLTDLSVFNSSDRWYFNVMDMGYGIKRRLTLDYDSNIWSYSLNDSSWLWLVHGKLLHNHVMFMDFVEGT